MPFFPYRDHGFDIHWDSTASSIVSVCTKLVHELTVRVQNLKYSTSPDGHICLVGQFNLILVSSIWSGLELFVPLSSNRPNLSYDNCLKDKREDYQNRSLLYCVPQLYTVISTHIWAVFTGVLGTADLSFSFVCVFLPMDFLFILCFLCFWCIFSCLYWVVSTSASDHLERLVFDMTYKTTHSFTHSRELYVEK